MLPQTTYSCDTDNVRENVVRVKIWETPSVTHEIGPVKWETVAYGIFTSDSYGIFTTVA